MNTPITIEEITYLANVPESLHSAFLRVANGLHERAKYPKEKVFLMLVKMLNDPKKYAYSKNKLTNLAKTVFDFRKAGTEITLTDDGKELIYNEEAVLTLEEKEPAKKNTFSLREDKLHYAVFGKEHIEEGALAQMETAVSLPISVAGALMPDAHQGYGLPIGGVLATEADKVIPYAVGVDIACRMCMSVFGSKFVPPTKTNLISPGLSDFSNFSTGAFCSAQ